MISEGYFTGELKETKYTSQENVLTSDHLTAGFPARPVERLQKNTAFQTQVLNDNTSFFKSSFINRGKKHQQPLEKLKLT